MSKEIIKEVENLMRKVDELTPALTKELIRTADKFTQDEGLSDLTRIKFKWALLINACGVVQNMVDRMVETQTIPTEIRKEEN